MFQRIADDFKDSARSAVRMSMLAMLTGFALLVTLSFLCAAAFIYIYQYYGLIDACLTGATIFLVVAVIGGICVAASRDVRPKKPPTEAPKSSAKSPIQAMLSDPVMLATGLQVVRAIGLKRLIPLLAIGGAAAGYFASRNASSDETDGDEQPD